MTTKINGRTFIYSKASGTQPAQWFEIIQTVAGKRYVRVMADTVEREEQNEADYREWLAVQETHDDFLAATGRR